MGVHYFLSIGGDASVSLSQSLRNIYCGDEVAPSTGNAVLPPEERLFDAVIKNNG